MPARSTAMFVPHQRPRWCGTETPHRKTQTDETFWNFGKAFGQSLADDENNKSILTESQFLQC
jgi:hypothetical protein